MFDILDCALELKEYKIPVMMDEAMCLSDNSWNNPIPGKYG